MLWLHVGESLSSSCFCSMDSKFDSAFYLNLSFGVSGCALYIGINNPPAPLLVVSVVNLSAMMVMSASGRRCCTFMAVDRPTTPAPITAIRTIASDTLLKL